MPRVVAMDGPAGAGKTTTAIRLSRETGWERVDTGLFYRAMCVGIEREHGDWPVNLSEDIIAGWARDNEGRIKQVAGAILLDEADVTSLCRQPEVHKSVASVARLSTARVVGNSLTAQAIAEAQSDLVIMDGRNETRVHASAGRLAMGVYLTAATEVRGPRRELESWHSDKRLVELLASTGMTPDEVVHLSIKDRVLLRAKLLGESAEHVSQAIVSVIAERDAQDIGRETEPLTPAYELGFKFVYHHDDIGTPPTDIRQVGIDNGYFEGKTSKQDELIVACVDYFATAA